MSPRAALVLLCASAALPAPAGAGTLPAFTGLAPPARAAPSLLRATRTGRPPLRAFPAPRHGSDRLPAHLRRPRAIPPPLRTYASAEGVEGGNPGMPTYQSMVEAAGGEWEGVYGAFSVNGALMSEGTCTTKGSVEGELLSLVTTSKEDGSVVMSHAPPDDSGASCAVFEGGGFSLGPAKINKEEGFEVVHCLPYGDERIRIVHTYNQSGRLEGMLLVHEVRKGTFDASQLAPFQGAPAHSNLFIAGVWKGTNMRVDITGGVPQVSYGEIQKFYQRSSGGSGLFQCLPLGVSSVAPPVYREGVSFYVGVGWTPAVSCDGGKCRDARPVAIRTYAKDGSLASVAQRIERRQQATPPAEGAGAGGAGKAGVDNAVAASAVAGYDIAKKMDEDEKARVKKWQEASASQEASGAGGQESVGGAVQKEEKEEEESELMKAIKSSDESLRMATVIGCKDISTEEAAPILWHVFDSNETDPAIREFAALALGFKPNNRSYEILTALVENEDHDEVRAAAAAGLGYLADPRAFDTLKMLLYEDHYSRARASAAVSLGMLRDVRSMDALIDGLSQDEVGVYDMVRACIGALGELGDVRAVKHILRFSKCDDFVTQQILAEALGNLACPEAEEALKFLQNEDHPNVQKAATIAREQIAARMLQRT